MVGNEGMDPYVEDPKLLSSHDSNAVVHIQAGDSIVFYNYHSLENARDSPLGDVEANKNLKAIHAGLPVTTENNEKWIATNWFRSNDLTGPFAHLHWQCLLEQMP